MTRIRLPGAMAVGVGGIRIEFGSCVFQDWSWLLRKVVLEICLLETDGKTGADEEGLDWLWMGIPFEGFLDSLIYEFEL
jgi:hypothetical protein